MNDSRSPKKVMVVMSNIRKSLEHEWFADRINRNDHFELDFVMINAEGSHLAAYFSERGYQVEHLSYRSRMDLPTLTLKLFRLMKRKKYDVVHAHLFEAYLSGMIAGLLAGIPKRIITRHHSDLHHTWHPHAVKYDRLINAMATDIVAISEVVREILIKWEGVPEHKVHLIPHGIDMAIFEDSPDLRARARLLREKYQIPETAVVVGVISRLTEWKGVQFILPAFRKLLESYPNAILFVANADGDYAGEIKKLSEGIPAKNLRMVAFEQDVTALYQVFNLFVHVPVSRESEAFGQVYVEALASCLPCVFTLSGVAGEMAVNERNCLTVPFKNSDAILDAMTRLIQDPVLGKSLGAQGKLDVAERYHVDGKIRKLEALYLK